MTIADPKLRDFARHLVDHEMLSDTPADTSTPAACRASEKLRPPLALLMGSVGVSALLSRAKALAGAENPWLGSVQVKADGAFNGFEELESQVSPDEFLGGCVALLAQLVGLLVALIGEDLTLRLLREAWPKLSLENFNVGEGGK
jgi:hypothetical protein